MHPLPVNALWIAGLTCLASLGHAGTLPGIEQTCFECHDQDTAKGDVVLTTLSFDPQDRLNRERWRAPGSGDRLAE